MEPSRLKILFVSVEVAPYAKVGGLADVASSLPKALAGRGHDVRIVTPAYGMILADERFNRTRVLKSVSVRPNRWSEFSATVDVIDHSGVPLYLIGGHEGFAEATKSDLVYTPGIEKYVFFTEAVLQIERELGWSPDIVHCNDWHTGFLPVLMREKYSHECRKTASVFTIHNFAYQGEFGTEILDSFGLHHSLYNPCDVEAWGRVNFLKSGCVFADRVNTVSRRYAEEIQTAQYGCALEGLMQHLRLEGRLSGILNGIDTTVFDPMTDPQLPAHFSAAKPQGKAACRHALLQRVGLPEDASTPVLGVVSRLSDQKGLDLLVEAIPELAKLPVQVVVQGLGDPWLVGSLRELEGKHPHHVRFIEAFDESSAQLIYGGSDFFAMPSRFEPCGLGQMIALRYGTIPVVRKTGGLADTIFEGQNGFVFQEATSAELFAAVARARQAFLDKKLWRQYVNAALTADFGWGASARQYEELYKQAIDAREKSAIPQDEAV